MENQLCRRNERARLLSATLTEGARRLLASGIETGRLDAELLLGLVLGMTREQLVIRSDEQLRPGQYEQYQNLLFRRLQREPIAYITQRQEFWSLDFFVNRDVLVPRPETELLVEVALKLAGRAKLSRALRILDIGTGSGAVAVALASELPSAEIFATDISLAALALARRNAATNLTSPSIRFFQGDLFAAISDGLTDGFHLIVSNPPYIRRDEIPRLEQEVSRWEPRRALDGGADGFDYYRRLAAESFRYLLPGGALALEIGSDMAAPVTTLFTNANYTDAEIHRDYNKRDRVFVVRRPAAA
jgi:release factor glutamine methyltransferase